MAEQSSSAVAAEPNTTSSVAPDERIMPQLLFLAKREGDGIAVRVTMAVDVEFAGAPPPDTRSDLLKEIAIGPEVYAISAHRRVPLPTPEGPALSAELMRAYASALEEVVGYYTLAANHMIFMLDLKPAAISQIGFGTFCKPRA
jgi:hypothetical protein